MQLTGNRGMFLQNCTGAEIESWIGGKVTHVVQVLSGMERYLCIDCWWLNDTFVVILELFVTAIVLD